MKKWAATLIIVILLAVIAFSLFVLYARGVIRPGINSVDECKKVCSSGEWIDGDCEWPSLMNEQDWNTKFAERNIPFPYSDVENKGPCVDAFLGRKSQHCGNNGQCNCYCFNVKNQDS